MNGSSIKYWWVLAVALWAPWLQAQIDTGYARVSSSSQGVVGDQKSEERKGKSSVLFWIMLVLALLFVVGSALMLKAIGGPTPKTGKERGNGSQRGEQ